MFKITQLLSDRTKIAEWLKKKIADSKASAQHRMYYSSHTILDYIQDCHLLEKKVIDSIICIIFPAQLYEQSTYYTVFI